MRLTRRIISAGILLACSMSAASAQDTPSLTVRTDWLPWGMHAGLHLAVEKGWFKEAGLDVEVSDGKGSSLTMQQVAAGDIDVGWVQLGAMASARGQGMPIISIAGLARKGDLGALVPKDANIRTVKDLEGKKVAYTAATQLGLAGRAVPRAGGTDRSDKLELRQRRPDVAALGVSCPKAADCTSDDLSVRQADRRPPAAVQWSSCCPMSGSTSRATA